MNKFNNLKDIKDKIEELRKKLNDSIFNDESPQKILKLSQDLDKLMNIYYAKKENKK